jgi:hypothetical protein
MAAREPLENLRPPPPAPSQRNPSPNDPPAMYPLTRVTMARKCLELRGPGPGARGRGEHRETLKNGISRSLGLGERARESLPS